jgi:thiamine-phosphate pyrophosphorylase
VTRLLLYYITDRTQFPGNEGDRRERLLDKIAQAARSGFDFVQLREKDLSSRDVEVLAFEAVRRIRAYGGPTRLMINSRTDIALAAGIDGVHLRSQDIAAADVRKIWRKAGWPNIPVIAISCHDLAEVLAAEKSGADFVVFGPVFEKKDSLETRPTGLDALRSASQHKIPVLALGGVTEHNARLCIEAGAAGVAGIRLFQTGEMSKQVAALRR